MAVNKLVADVEQYLKWAGSGGTTKQEYQEFVRNIFNVVTNLVSSAKMWQPQTEYSTNTVIRAPSMDPNTVARVTKAGTTATMEPSWTGVGTTVNDGTVTYVIVPDTIDFATDAETAAGTNANKIVSPARLHKALTDGLAPKMNSADITNTFLWSLLHSKGVNFVPSDVTNTGWNKLGVFSSYYTKSVLKNQPTQYGQLINIPADKNSTESTQLWIAQYSGKIYYRGGNGSVAVNDTAFTTFPTTGDLDSQVSTLKGLISSAAASGGVVAGNVSNANAWWVKLGGTIPLIIQGGYNYHSTTASEQFSGSLTFPVAFSTILSIATSINETPSYPIVGCGINSLSNKGFSFKCWGVNDASRHGGFRYIAIGR